MDLPEGYRYAGVACGIKQQANRKDLSLVVADRPVVAAGVYTQNRVVAAPVVVCRGRTPTDRLRAVVINSGNANACTGTEGERNAYRMTQLVAGAIGEFDEQQVLPLSTGIIGRQLPMDRVSSGISSACGALQSSAEAFHDAADGILTTDKSRKVASRRVQINGGSIRIAGMAKGAGMIGPNMATMLSVVICDAPLTPDDASRILKNAADRSFNRISVEGHTSTNDTLLLLCSGQGEPLEGEDRDQFSFALTEMCIELAKQIPADGEGSQHLVEIEVRGARDEDDATRIAKTVAQSALVKTAVTGNDPNWGRIVSAAGYADAEIDVDHLTLDICGHRVFENGQPLPLDEAAVSGAMRESDVVTLKLTVGKGMASTRFWTSDLTKAYVEFNSDYTS